eukprot:1157732-Pelagomonas_calceolata.AAC.2
MEFLATKGSYCDESAKLREAVCKRAGLPEDQAEEAVCQLSRKDPGLLRELMKVSIVIVAVHARWCARALMKLTIVAITIASFGLLRELMKEHGNFTTQVINAELGALSELLQKALSKIAELEAAHARAAMRQYPGCVKQDSEMRGVPGCFAPGVRGRKKKRRVDSPPDD